MMSAIFHGSILTKRKKTSFKKMNTQNNLQRFLILAVIFLTPYGIIFLLPGSIYPQRYHHAMDLMDLGIQRKNIQEEQAGVKALLDVYPYHCQATLQTARLLSQQQDQIQETVQAFSYARDQGCLDEPGMLMLFNLQLDAGLKRDAEQNMQAWLMKNPYASDAVYQAWIAYWQSEKELEETVQAVRLWMNEQPHNLQALTSGIHYAALFSQEERRNLLDASLPLVDVLPQEAQSILQALKQSEGMSTDTAAYSLGAAYSNLEIWDMAEICFQDSVESEPERAEAWLYLALAQKKLGKASSQALLEANRRSIDSDLYRSLMGLYWRDTNPEIAYIYWMKLIASQPDMPEWRIEAGAALALLGEQDAAAAQYEQAVGIAPERFDLRYAYARFCLTYEYDIHGTGFEQTRAMIRLKPESEQGYLLESRMLIYEEDYLTAERMLLQAKSRAPRSAEVLYTFGTLYLALENRTQANIYFQQASQMDDSTYAVAAARMMD
jgi:hypothetical protein